MDEAAREREAWERIAPSWAAARARPWPLVERFLEGLPPGARVLDAGAGAGRHARAARERGLQAWTLDAARAFRPDVRADAAALPWRDRAFDAVLLVAVLGTMPRRAGRVQALREARRVLRPGGAMLLTVWARWQPRYARALLGLGPWRRLGPGEVEAPWPSPEGAVARRYHLYTARGLGAELAEAGWGSPGVERARMGARGPRDNFVVRARKESAGDGEASSGVRPFAGRWPP